MVCVVGYGPISLFRGGVNLKYSAENLFYNSRLRTIANQISFVSPGPVLSLPKGVRTKVNWFYGFVNLKNCFVNWKNRFANWKNRFANLKNRFVNLKNRFVNLKNGFVNCLCGKINGFCKLPLR